MCADPNAGARQAARAKHRQKVFDYQANSNKFWYKELDYKNKKQFIQGIGESRQLSDVRQAVLNKRSAGLSALIPNFFLFFEIDFVLRVLTVVVPPFDIADCGSGLICSPDQFTDQSFH